jgi:hypothetical protein
MKRTAVNDAGHSPKRHKSEPLELECFPDPFDARLQKNARDVCANGTDGSGFISGIAFMVWPGGGSGVRRVLMQVEEQGRIEQFELKLSGRCRKYFERLDFCSKDHFEISLKGAEMEKKQESSKPFHLPMALTYNQGVIIKFTKRIRKPTENGLVIDTWQRAFHSHCNLGILHRIVGSLDRSLILSFQWRKLIEGEKKLSSSTKNMVDHSGSHLP